MKLTAEVINSARIFLNTLLDREIDLRGECVALAGQGFELRMMIG